MYIHIRKTCSYLYESFIYRTGLETPDDFEKLWNLPHVLGGIDGKHFDMDCPKRSGSKYHNYKDFYDECFESYELFTYSNVRFL